MWMRVCQNIETEQTDFWFLCGLVSMLKSHLTISLATLWSLAFPFGVRGEVK